MTDIKISKTEFEQSFGHASIYGVRGGWPRNTRIFYKFTDWRRSDHHCWHSCYMEPAHFKIEELSSCLHLHVIMDKSPCSECAKQLVKMKSENENLQISVKFSSFYNLYEPDGDEGKCEDHLKNIKGLMEMIEKGMKLHVFNGEEDWKQFLEFVLNVPQSEQEEWLTCIRTDEKRQREKVDMAILQDIRNRALSIKDIMNMASAKTEKEVEEELARRNGKFIFKEDDRTTQYLDSIQRCKEFFKSSRNGDLSHYFFKVGSGTWSTCITNEEGTHAEVRMIESIKKEDFQIRAGKCPCYYCCKILMRFKAKLNCLNTISIMFQDFTSEGNFRDNITALIEAVEKGIKLDRLHGEVNWKYFFENFVKMKHQSIESRREHLAEEQVSEKNKETEELLYNEQALNGMKSGKRKDGKSAHVSEENDVIVENEIDKTKPDQIQNMNEGAVDVGNNEFIEWRRQLEIEDPANGVYLLQDIIACGNRNNYEGVLKLLGLENPDLLNLEYGKGEQQRKRQGDTSPCRDQRKKIIKSEKP